MGGYKRNSAWSRQVRNHPFLEKQEESILLYYKFTPEFAALCRFIIPGFILLVERAI